jgi:hypothetical protein
MADQDSGEADIPPDAHGLLTGPLSSVAGSKLCLGLLLTAPDVFASRQRDVVRIWCGGKVVASQR